MGSNTACNATPQETGLGLARRTEQEEGSQASEDSNDDANGARGFFLADGTPNIRLRRWVYRYDRLVWYFECGCTKRALTDLVLGSKAGAEGVSYEAKLRGARGIVLAGRALKVGLRGHLICQRCFANEICSSCSMLLVMLTGLRCVKSGE